MLVNTLTKELESQSAVLTEDLQTPAQVATEHKSFLQAAGFKIHDDPASTTVRLVKDLDASTQLMVGFDVAQVVQRSAAAEQDLDGEAEDGEEMQFDEGGVENVEVEVEVVRKGQDLKMVLNCELDVGYEVAEEQGEDDASSTASLYITDARLVPVTSAPSAPTPTTMTPYEGPDYSTLDEQLQTAMTEFVEEAVGDLSALARFVDAYSGSKEGAMYERWLSTVKNIVA